ncbi:MAG: pyruvate kinase, partial [Chloroflexota bacterium]
MRRTKIVCTLGPASSSGDTLRAMIRAGMDVARLNFSHGNHESHEALISAARKAAKEEGRVIAILQDLQGPRVRVGEVAGDQIFLSAGSRVTLTTREVLGTPEQVTVRGAPLADNVEPNDRILLDDGNIELQVVKASGTEVNCIVKIGGSLKSNKGVVIPGRTLSVPTITEKDKKDVAFGLAQGVDYVAMSFVRSAEGIHQLRGILCALGADETPIVAKIEKHEAIQNFDEILLAADAIMVARGDLGIEMAAEEVPLLQKMIISKCNKAGKPVVTATQMLDSMIRNPRPTRAEVNDVANAILDGSDATMLSGETAAGAYPVQSVSTMARIAERTDAALPYDILNQKIS